VWDLLVPHFRSGMVLLFVSCIAFKLCLGVLAGVAVFGCDGGLM